MAKKYQRAIHWFRRDLRLSDNSALFHASEEAVEVVPLYIRSRWKKTHNWTGAPRQDFLCGCLASLHKNLQSIGSRLLIRSGSAESVLKKLILESRADALFFNRDPDPFGQEVEKRVRQLCRSIGIAFCDYKDVVLHEPDEVLTGNGQAYRVFTPYSKNWFSQSKTSPFPRVKRLVTATEFSSDDLPSLESWQLPENPCEILPPGERAGRDRLTAALENSLHHYAEKRDIPSLHATSLLGADLRFGTISAREVFASSTLLWHSVSNVRAQQSIATFQKQLAWREYFMAILGKYPHVLETDFSEKWRDLVWDDPTEDDRLEKWKQGMTGFPLVDAGMRQLRATGYMHNRVRMIVAMFLTKDLHLHWKLGESHFMQWLIDGEIANNNGGWQWSAGTGADAAPYFRIQNPWTQTARYDPEGLYIKQWVPELREVQDPRRFQKPAAPLDPLSPEYPIPIVDHKTEREETLARFKRV